MANAGNLVPFANRTETEQRKIRSKGGKRSGEVRRAKRTARELAQLMLSCAAPDKVRDQISRLFPEMDASEIDIKTALLTKKIQNGLNGKSSDIDSILDIAGEMPNKTQKVEMAAQVSILTQQQIDAMARAEQMGE